MPTPPPIAYTSRGEPSPPITGFKGWLGNTGAGTIPNWYKFGTPLITGILSLLGNRAQQGPDYSQQYIDLYTRMGDTQRNLFTSLLGSENTSMQHQGLEGLLSPPPGLNLPTPTSQPSNLSMLLHPIIAGWQQSIMGDVERTNALRQNEIASIQKLIGSENPVEAQAAISALGEAMQAKRFKPGDVYNHYNRYYTDASAQRQRESTPQLPPQLYGGAPPPAQPTMPPGATSVIPPPSAGPVGGYQPGAASQPTTSVQQPPSQLGGFQGGAFGSNFQLPGSNMASAGQGFGGGVGQPPPSVPGVSGAIAQAPQVSALARVGEGPPQDRNAPPPDAIGALLPAAARGVNIEEIANRFLTIRGPYPKASPMFVTSKTGRSPEQDLWLKDWYEFVERNTQPITPYQQEFTEYRKTEAGLRHEREAAEAKRQAEQDTLRQTERDENQELRKQGLDLQRQSLGLHGQSVANTQAARDMMEQNRVAAIEGEKKEKLRELDRRVREAELASAAPGAADLPAHVRAHVIGTYTNPYWVREERKRIEEEYEIRKRGKQVQMVTPPPAAGKKATPAAPKPTPSAAPSPKPSAAGPTSSDIAQAKSRIGQYGYAAVLAAAQQLPEPQRSLMMAAIQAAQ